MMVDWNPTGRERTVTLSDFNIVAPPVPDAGSYRARNTVTGEVTPWTVGQIEFPHGWLPNVAIESVTIADDCVVGFTGAD